MISKPARAGADLKHHFPHSLEEKVYRPVLRTILGCNQGDGAER